MIETAIESPRRIFHWRGWMGAILILPAVMAASVSPPGVVQGTALDNALTIVGWLIFAGGVFMRLWSMLYIGGRKRICIFTDGPYAMCRHPLYLGSLMIGIALPLLMESWTVLLAVATAALMHAFIVIPSEEKHAVDCFGEAYRNYAKKTPRYVPRFSQLRRPGIIAVKVGPFLRELGRAFGCAVVGGLAVAFAHVRLLPWWPHLCGFHSPAATCRSSMQK